MGGLQFLRIESKRLELILEEGANLQTSDDRTRKQIQA